MGRKRLSWTFNDRTADPYEMNQDRDNQYPAQKYMIGDPSAFAEDVHDDMPDDSALGRNEVGLPNMSDWNMTHKDVDEWNSDAPYDNADTFSPEDMDREASSRRKRKQAAERKRRMFASAQKKARRCIKIAEALFPGVPEQVLEDQAVDFMSLSDRVVEATLERLQKADEYKKEAEADALLREMLSEDKEDKDDKEDKEDKDEDDDKKESSTDAMLREMLSEEDDKDEDDDKDDKEEDEDEEDDDKESSLSEMAEMDEDEEDVEAMIDKMMMEDGEDAEMAEDAMMDEEAEMHESYEADMNIEMEPTLETVDAGGIEEDDRVLNQLFNDTVPKEAREQETVSEQGTSKQARKGVSTLGGRVKAASDQDTQGDDLSGLWAEDPDVSDMF